MIAANISVFENLLTKSLENAESKVNEVASAKNKQETNSAAYIQCELAIKEVQQMKKSFLMEMSQLPASSQEKAPLRAMLEAYDQRLGKLQQTYKTEKGAFEKSQLIGTPAALAARNKDPSNPQSMLDETKNIQAQTLTSLQKSRSKMQETIHVGRTVAEELEAQSEQIARINQEVNEVQNEINKANQILTTIVRRIATDRVVWCFVVIVVTLVIAVIVLFATGTIGSPNSPAVPGI